MEGLRREGVEFFNFLEIGSLGLILCEILVKKIRNLFFMKNMVLCRANMQKFMFLWRKSKGMSFDFTEPRISHKTDF